MRETFTVTISELRSARHSIKRAGGTIVRSCPIGRDRYAVTAYFPPARVLAGAR